MYCAMDVAKYIIWYGRQKRYSISNLKLQKILYFVQATFLVNFEKPCFKEDIEAWDFGPVVSSVYHQFKIYGSANIPKNVADNAETLILRSDRQVINDMVDQCAKYSAATLVDITHNQKPWKDVYQKNCNNIIKQESIIEYFKEE